MLDLYDALFFILILVIVALVVAVAIRIPSICKWLSNWKRFTRELD